MPETDLELLKTAAFEAGEIATGFARDALDVQHKADGAGPVTQADLAVNEHLLQRLRKARPDYAWLSEESADDDARLSADRVFIIDPIDGTRSFIEGANTWAHSLAIAERGEIIAAAVYLPLRDKLYTARKGGGAHLNGAALCASSNCLPGASVLAAKPNFTDEHWPDGLPEMARHYRPSLAYRLSLVAEGRFDAMFTFRPTWEWDIAAGALILTEAGARVSDQRGRDLRFNNPGAQTDGIIAAGPDLHEDLVKLHGGSADL